MDYIVEGLDILQWRSMYVYILMRGKRDMETSRVKGGKVRETWRGNQVDKELSEDPM